MPTLSGSQINRPFILFCKLMGLTQNLKTSKLVNFETLKEMVLNEYLKIQEIKEVRITINKTVDVLTVDNVK